MKTTFVFDACALIAHFRNEEGAEQVRKLFFTPQATRLVHAVNACEIFYDFRRAAGEEVAQSVIADFKSLGIMVCHDMEATLWQAAGRRKAEFRRISLADCFALALAEREDAVLVTSDHHEFDPLVNQVSCLIYFIR